MDHPGDRIGRIAVSALVVVPGSVAGVAAWVLWYLRRQIVTEATTTVCIIAGLIGIVAMLAGILVRDLWRRCKTEPTTRESEERYRLLADHSSDMIILINLRDKKRHYVSPSSRRLFGYEPEELIGQSIESMIHPDDVGALRKAEEELQNFGRAIITARNRRKDGHYIWVETTWEKITNSRSGELELVAIARDVTERVHAEEALRAAVKAAEAARIRADEANRAKSQFLANMSHELRTPINGIMGMSHLLLESSLTDEQLDYAKTITACGTSLLALINDILDLSKLEAGGMVLERVPFDLSTLVETVVSMMTPLARDKELDLSASISAEARGSYVGDPMRLRQALINLVGNAIKFTELGSVRIDISSAYDAEGAPLLCFAVLDTGIGISETALGGLFQKFTQADASIARKYGGTGLGLAITKQLVQLMGGTISASSHEGVGSHFWFEVPLPRVAEVVVSERVARPAPLDPSPRKLRVLVVEDNTVNQLVAQTILEKAGHQVDIVDDGHKAIEAVQAKTYDVALMDIQMSGLDGMEATACIRALPPPACAIPIIALTANALAGAREEYLSAGMDGYISKPFDPPELLATLDRIAASPSP
jgi:PAS domain S-box-containing protein